MFLYFLPFLLVVPTGMNNFCGYVILIEAMQEQGFINFIFLSHDSSSMQDFLWHLNI